jgi:hypothetical protein
LSNLGHGFARRFYARKVLIEVGEQHAHDELPTTVMRGRHCDVVQVNSRARIRVARLVATRTAAVKLNFPTITPTAIDLSPSGSDKEMAEENILDTYQSSWNDFYAWELEYASEAIASLATDFPARDLPDAEDSYFSQDIDILSFRPLKRPVSGVPLSPPKDLPNVQAHPRYQACTPSNRNIMAKRPQHNPFILTLFIPFADEPRFQSKYFLEEFLQDSDYEDPKLFWQSLADPDREFPSLTLRKSAINVERREHTVSGIPEAPSTRIHHVSD